MALSDDQLVLQPDSTAPNPPLTTMFARAAPGKASMRPRAAARWQDFGMEGSSPGLVSVASCRPPDRPHQGRQAFRFGGRAANPLASGNWDSGHP